MIGASQAGPSTGFLKKTKTRKRRSKSSRKAKGRCEDICYEDVVKKQGSLLGSVEKRKAEDELEGVSSAVRVKTPLMVPKEGLSKI